MKTRFIVGDVVRLKNNLKGNRLYGNLMCTQEMAEMHSKDYEVASITKEGYYKFKGYENWTFTSQMISRRIFNKINIDINEIGYYIYGETKTISFKTLKPDWREKYEQTYVVRFYDSGANQGWEYTTYYDGLYCRYVGSYYQLDKAEFPRCLITGSIYDNLDEQYFKLNKIEPVYDFYSNELAPSDELRIIFDFQAENGSRVGIIHNNTTKKLLLAPIENIEIKGFDDKPQTTEVKESSSDLKIEQLTLTVQELVNSMKQQQPLQEALTEAIIDKGKDIATKDLENRIKENIDEFIEKQYGVLPKKIELIKQDIKKPMSGIFHKEFEHICKIIDQNVPLMLVGSAGAGKNHTLEQVADALGLDFYTTGAINQEYKLTGFIDANGVYHETEFYKAFKYGGLFFLDEIDASTAEVLVILNGAIANKYFDFPTGRITANENFRVVCAGNTYGTGADMVYVGRNVLDGATLDRFVVLPFDYDSEVEKQLAYDNELFEFIQDLRKAVNDSNLRYIISMRAIINATKLLQIGLDKKFILETAIIKNMQKDDLNTIVHKLNNNNEWVKFVKEMCDNVNN